MARRSYGSGSLYVKTDSAGAETWYGQWRVRDRQVKRRLGPKRRAGTRDGLTRAQAEAELRRRIAEDVPPPPSELRVTVGEAGQRLLQHLGTLGRKRSTLMDYESYLRVHLAPFFGDRPLDAIDSGDIEAFIAERVDAGKAPKSIKNWVALLHSIFDYAIKRGWCSSNPCKLVELPRSVDVDPDIRFLDAAELHAVVAAVPDDALGSTERALYPTATTTGLRQGELLALRWRDIDWGAAKIRVRQNYVRGEYGTPKSKRSSRAVPLADSTAGLLERHFQSSAYQADDDLVFCHPQSGKPLDRSKVRKRFVAAVKRAGVRRVRFHDLRHTFGTAMAGAGVPLRTLQEWMGHRDFKTTQLYADYQPSEHEAAFAERAFGQGSPWALADPAPVA